MTDFMRQSGANPGRAGHTLALAAARKIFEVREAVAQFFGVPDSAQVIFFQNATMALNQALKGFLQPGDQVLISALEHNAVVRPLEYLRRTRGVEYAVVSAPLELTSWQSLITAKTRLVVATYVSNVTGACLPIRQIGQLCRSLGVTFLVDAAQSAGHLPLDLELDHIDLLAFTGHKALWGAQGVGGLCLRTPLPLVPLVHGGTGSHSESAEQPAYLPDLLESGTLNGPGIIALGAGLQFIAQNSLAQIREHETALVRNLWTKLAEIKQIKIHSSVEASLVSFTVAGRQTSDLAYELDKKGILCRAGLHCAPLAHQSSGTLPGGTVRFSLGYFNTHAEIELVAQALQKIIQ